MTVYIALLSVLSWQMKIRKEIVTSVQLYVQWSLLVSFLNICQNLFMLFFFTADLYQISMCALFQERVYFMSILSPFFFPAPSLHSTRQDTSVVHMLVLLKATLVHSLRREACSFLQPTWLTEQLFSAPLFLLSPVTAPFTLLTSHKLFLRIRGLSLGGQQLLCYLGG